MIAEMIFFLMGALVTPAVVEGDEGVDEQEPANLPVFYATATVQERAVASSTAAVTVLESELLKNSGAASALEALAFVPGVNLVSGATRGGATLALIRGGDPNYTSVLIDGVLVNDGTNQTGGIFNLEALPIDAVERVEVVRGPFSSIYGSTGLAGAIQVITRRGEGPLHSDGQLTAGDANLYRAGVSVAAGKETSDFFVHLLAEGEEERIANESYDLYHLQARQRQDFGARHTLQLNGRFASWSGDDYPDASGGPVFGTGELRRADNEELGVGARWLVNGPEGWLHRFDGAFYRHDLERSSPAVVPLVPPSTEDTRMTRSRVGWASSLQTKHGLWSFGAELEREKAINQSLLLLPPFFGGDVVGDYSETRDIAGAYTEWTYRSEKFVWELGLRVDAPDDLGTELNPRLGFAYSLGGGGTRLVVSAGRAFKLPSFFALSSPRALGGNPDLVPEIVIGGDFGIEHRFDEGRAQVGLKVFLQEFEDLVDFDFGSFLHVNRSRVDAQGVEFTFDWRPKKAWTVATNLTWQEVEDAATGLALRHRPEWAGAIRVAWQAGRNLDVHGDLRFSSSRVDEQIPVPDRQRVDGYQLLGLAASWQVSPRWRISARLDNLSDEDYETLIGFPGPSRSGRLAFGWTLGSLVRSSGGRAGR